MAAERLAQFCSGPPHDWILIKQVHDEASMRLRSCLQGLGGLKRGRSSKIQNAVISVHRDASPVNFVRLPVELMALERKNAPTLATALLRSLQEVVGAACLYAPTRTTHVVIGDGVATNEAACRVVYAFMRERAPTVDYS